MMLLRRQNISILQRWQYYTICENRLLSSSTFSGGIDIFSAVRHLSLNSTSTLQQNYNDAPSLQHVITRSNLIQSHIYQRQYQLQISNNIIHNYYSNNRLRWFGSSGGRHTHHGSRGRGNDRGRGHQSTNRIPRMKDCRTLEDAIKAVYDNLDKVSPRDISAFWAVVPRLLKYQERGVNLVQQLEAIFYKTADQIHSYRPQDLTTTTLGFAKIIQALQKSKRGYVSGSYEGYLHGILISQRDAVFSFLARTAVPILHQFPPRELKDLAYAYALLEYVPKLKDGSTLFNHIAEKSIPLLDKFKPQHISNTVWAFEKAKVPHPDLFKEVGDHIVTRQQLNDFTPQNLSNIVWAFAKAGVIHPTLFSRVGDHIVSLDHLHDFCLPQNLANVVYSFAKAEISHQGLFNKVADHIVSLDNLDGYNEQEISNLVWSYHKVRVIRQDLNDKLISVAIDRKFSMKRLKTLNRWASERGIQNIEDDDNSGDSIAVDDDNENNSIEDAGIVVVVEEEEEEDTTAASIPEDLSLLTVVQLKDRLRDIGLPVSGRKQELIDRLNDHFQL